MHLPWSGVYERALLCQNGPECQYVWLPVSASSVLQGLSVGPAFSTCLLLLVHITIITFNLLFDILQCLTQDVTYSWTKPFFFIYFGLSFRRHAISARCCFLTSAVLHHTREFISINLHTRVLNVEQSADLSTSRLMSLRTACIIPEELVFGQYNDYFCCQFMYNLCF